MFSAPEARDFVELILLYICAVMKCPFLKAPICFPTENNTERQSRAGQGHCQFHLTILYHHLDNDGCFVTA